VPAPEKENENDFQKGRGMAPKYQVKNVKTSQIKDKL
jgi:hypothetical protein